MQRRARRMPWLAVLVATSACSGKRSADPGSESSGGMAGAAGSGGVAGGAAGDAGSAPGGMAGSAGAGAGTAGAGGAEGGAGGGGARHVFRKIVLSTAFTCEGATFGDFDRDGTNDVVAGPYWYRGPEFTERHEIYPETVFDVVGYSDNFFAFARDLSGDGWLDVLFVGFPGQSAYWFENPAGGDAWTRHEVVAAVGNESPDYTDITGDGEPELVYIEMQPGNTMGRYGFAAPGDEPRAPWTFRPISTLGAYSHFTHGMGVGDVDGDGRADLLDVTGYFSQPASLDGDPLWEKREHAFGQGGAQIAVLDLDGDGDRDVVTTLAAHGYGLSWFSREGDAFVEHNIVPAAASDSGVVLHEPHALTTADIDGDGLLDIVTGERHWAHAPENGDFAAPARLYWFQTVRSGGEVAFVPHLVDDQSGVGTQVVAGDIDGDGLVDLVVANKKGAFVFLHELDED